MIIRAIIPCAGYGTRVGMRSNQSKELLIDPKTKEPIINWCLRLCKKYNIKPLIVTRKEKNDLIKYIRNLKWIKCNLLIVNPGKEWAETVLKSKHRWFFNNILILPDTRWNNSDQIFKNFLLNFSKENKLMFGVFPVKNPQKWSIIEKNYIAEKPTICYTTSYFAWGIIAFSKSCGSSLFSSLVEKNKWYKIHSKYILFNLEKFRDITRRNINKQP